MASIHENRLAGEPGWRSKGKELVILQYACYMRDHSRSSIVDLVYSLAHTNGADRLLRQYTDIAFAWIGPNLQLSTRRTLVLATYRFRFGFVRPSANIMADDQ
jgi:hypothetical protein